MFADVDGDKALDVIVTATGANFASIRFGDGIGGFKSIQATFVDVGGGSNFAALGDINGDGFLDIAVASQNERAETGRE